jgi:hypothetical protein
MMPSRTLGEGGPLLLARNEYLAAESRILKTQLKGRLRLSDAERATLGEIGHRLGRKVLGEVATVARPDTILAWYVSLSPASSMARKPVAARADRASRARSSSSSFAWPRRTDLVSCARDSANRTATSRGR